MNGIALILNRPIDITSPDAWLFISVGNSSIK